MDLYIGIDIGTSSAKMVVADHKGQPLCQTGRSYSLYTPEPGYAEQDAGEIIAALMDGISAIFRQCHTLGNVRGIGLSCAMHGVLLLDEHNTPISPVITWADKRSASCAERIQQTETGHKIYAQTGTPIHAMTPLTKLVWLRENQPALLEQTAKIVSIKEYFTFILTGAFLIDHSIASATGLFNLFDRTWDTRALQLVGLSPAHFSKPVSTTSLLPPLKPEIATQLGISQDVPWVVGASDGCLANLGVHANEPSKAVLTIGTSGAIRVTTHTPRVDDKRRLFTYILDDERYIVGGSINNGGIMLKWFQEHLMGLDKDPEDLKRRLSDTSKIPAGSDGLFCLPYLLGERAPHWNSYDRGVYFGVRFEHNSSHFLKSLMEGIAMTLQQIGHAIEGTCGPFDKILANGGVLQSPEWLQILADVFGKPVIVTPAQDASAMGAIFLAMQTLGTEPDLASVDTSSQQILPEPGARTMYQKMLPVFSNLYNKLQSDFVQLHTL